MKILTDSAWSASGRGHGVVLPVVGEKIYNNLQQTNIHLRIKLIYLTHQTNDREYHRILDEVSMGNPHYLVRDKKGKLAKCPRFHSLEA